MISHFPLVLIEGRKGRISCQNFEACKDALAAMKEADGKAKAASKALKAGSLTNENRTGSFPWILVG